MDKQQAQKIMDDATQARRNRTNAELEGYDPDGLMEHITDAAIDSILAAGYAVIYGKVYDRDDFDKARAAFNGVIQRATIRTAADQAYWINKAEEAAGMSTGDIGALKSVFCG